MIDSLTEAYKKKNKKIISKIYQGLQKLEGKNTGYIMGERTQHK